MKTIAIYNMKGGVGKTTTAVNLAYLAAEAGHRTLLWDLDPQAASTFAYRVRPRVASLDKSILADGEGFSAAIRQTDYDNLCVLPADFAYRKLDRWLSSLGHPHRVFSSLLEAVGRDFELVLLDCPPGFSGLTESTLAAADAVIAPTIPTVLSLRTLARLFGQADRVGARCTIAAFFNMVDRRKTLHRRVCELAASHRELFLSTHVPYASVVEQLTARRKPLAVFAPHEPATRAFADLWMDVQRRIESADVTDGRACASARFTIESLVDRLETTERPAAPSWSEVREPADDRDEVVHRFDTDRRDLEHAALIVELRERRDNEFVVVVRPDAGGPTAGAVEARIDRWWTVQILAESMSPLEALERRIGKPWPPVIESVRCAVGDRALRRVDTRRGVAHVPDAVNLRSA